ncbi:hypothetical protein BP5796_04516 [Coleophoma crateriformis]|uniref:Uncharacterized protein n=1 Tax=Coleophoma crateriformis TaxID=565419 RepID=A0A3D8S9K1_9HELO|nr:hypothetical protein BP5796_04516 [Coleophoma crateriformis]
MLDGIQTSTKSLGPTKDSKQKATRVYKQQLLPLESIIQQPISSTFSKKRSGRQKVFYLSSSSCFAHPLTSSLRHDIQTRLQQCEAVSFCSIKLTTSPRPCTRTDEYITSPRACKTCRQQQTGLSRLSRALKQRLTKTLSNETPRWEMILDNNDSILFDESESPEGVLQSPVRTEVSPEERHRGRYLNQFSREDELFLPKEPQPRRSVEHAGNRRLRKEKDVKGRRRDQPSRATDQELFLSPDKVVKPPVQAGINPEDRHRGPNLNQFSWEDELFLPKEPQPRRSVEHAGNRRLRKEKDAKSRRRDQPLRAVNQELFLAPSPATGPTPNRSAISSIKQLSPGEHAREPQLLDSREVSHLSRGSVQPASNPSLLSVQQLDSKEVSHTPTPKPRLTLLPSIRRLSSIGTLHPPVSPVSLSELPTSLYELPVSPISPEVRSDTQGQESKGTPAELDNTNIFGSFLGNTNVDFHI